MDLLGPALWVLDQVRGSQQRRRRLLVLVHRAVFAGSSLQHWFVKVTNVSPNREVEVTHIWFASTPTVHFLNPERPLPARLRLDETYETWIPCADLPDGMVVKRLARVRLSTGKVVKGRANPGVPPAGSVGGRGDR